MLYTVHIHEVNNVVQGAHSRGEIKMVEVIFIVLIRMKYILRSELQNTNCVILLIHIWAAAAAAKSLQSCQTLCDPIAGSPPGSPVPGILQARTLEWVAISFPNAWKWKVEEKLLSHVWLLATPWTAAYQAPPSIPIPSWDFPGKSTGVGCHCLLYIYELKALYLYLKLIQWKYMYEW